jgi:hypothetical protein
MELSGASYDPDTLTLLRKILDDSWQRLSPEQQVCTTKSDLEMRAQARGSGRTRSDPHGTRDIRGRPGLCSAFMTSRVKTLRPSNPNS